jgi:hypothetical protein
MKQFVLKGIKNNALLIIALIAFVIFTSNKNPDSESNITGRCCTGYNISINQLKQFMLDSLHGNQFEGGVYSKQSLLTAINAIPGDSVYLMNILKNCNEAKGTDLALTSLQFTGVSFVRQPNCYPCPGKACCPQTACAARIDRSCINYKVYNGAAGTSELNSVATGE